MRLEHEDVDVVKRQLRAILGRHLDLTRYRAFFFGSRVQGTGDDRSDIDIGIMGPAPIPPDIRFVIEEEIDGLPILYKMDVVDFSDVSEDFRRTALAHTEPI